MGYITVIHNGVKTLLKSEPTKPRSDKKYTVKTLLTESEKRILNKVILKFNYNHVLEFVSLAIANHIHLGITENEIAASKRRLKNADGIQINGRLNIQLYEKFREVQAENNLSQRHLVYILVSKAVHMAGFKFN